MPVYLTQAAYRPEAWAAQIKNPQNRIEVVRKTIEASGGKLLGAWFCFGEYDLVLVTEGRDNTHAASLAIAFAAGGAVKALKTTPLMTVEEGLEAIRMAGSVQYAPPG